MSLEALAQDLKKCAVVSWPPEQRSFADAPIEHMKIRFAVAPSTASRHRWASSLSKRGARANREAMTTETCPQISVICGKEI